MDSHTFYKLQIKHKHFLSLTLCLLDDAQTNTVTYLIGFTQISELVFTRPVLFLGFVNKSNWVIKLKEIVCGQLKKPCTTLQTEQTSWPIAFIDVAHTVAAQLSLELHAVLCGLVPS